MTNRQCDHKWKQYGYGTRTDQPGKTIMFYECENCNALYRG